MNYAKLEDISPPRGVTKMNRIDKMNQKKNKKILVLLSSIPGFEGRKTINLCNANQKKKKKKKKRNIIWLKKNMKMFFNCYFDEWGFLCLKPLKQILWVKKSLIECVVVLNHLSSI